MSAQQALDRTVRLVRDLISDEIPDEVIVERLQACRVRCIADEGNLSTLAGQTALITLVCLIARLGVQVVLDVPEMDLIGPNPPLHGLHLRAALVDLGADLVPGTTITCDDLAPCDLTFALGDTPVPDTGTAAWRLAGTAWAGTIRPIGSPGYRWDVAWPVGGAAAAGLAAPEVFKAVLRDLPLRSAVEAEYLAPCSFAAWDFEGDALVLPSTEPVFLDIVSAGAISQATLFTLFRLPMRFAARLFDDDLAELSNLNRQLLLRCSDSGLKADIVARSAPPSFACTPVTERFALPASARHSPLARHVLVGVDDIPARWDVQRAAPDWLGVGATSHFGVSTSSHESQQPCAGCLHPTDDRVPAGPIPTISFVSFWAGLTLAVRLLRQIAGSGYAPAKQQLWLAPLRMDQRNAAWWSPVAARRDCPVRCAASQRLR